MKRNDWALIISVLLYTILFYKQTAGINFLIFNSAIVALLLYRDNSLFKNVRWLSVAIGAITSSFFIYMYGSALAIWANLFSLAILSVISIAPSASFFMSIFVTISSAGASCVFMILDWIKRKKKKIEETYKRPGYVKIFLFVIPFLIAVVFFFFYQSANPLFYEFTKDINLDFISFPWILFTFSGLLLMYGFYNNRRLDIITNIDVNAETNLTFETATRKNFLNGLMRMDTERLSGIILFGMLNLLLLLLNVLDINYFLFDGTLPEGITHKDFVHDGIGVLIMSIIFAIVIILFYFRGGLNFDEKNKWLKMMAVLWILQNAFMILSTAHRNNLYIQESGLTYKRIGVYVYLFLSLVGLITTFIKIQKVKTNWYLFRVNSAVYYYSIVLACIINWDVMISNFNIAKNKEEGKKLDKYFLLDLSYKNLPQLLQLPDTIASYNDYAARDFYYSSRNVFYRDFKSGLHTKLYNFMKNYKLMEWQSACVEKERTYTDLIAMKGQIKEIDLSNNYFNTLQPVFEMSAIEKLNFYNNHLDTLNELSVFSSLSSLNLGANELYKITDWPEMKSLKELYLRNNYISDYSPLSRTPNLTSLDISNDNSNIKFVDLKTLPTFSYLKDLNISGTSFKSLISIDKYRQLEALNVSSSSLANIDSFPYLPGLNVLNISNNSLKRSGSVLYRQLAKYTNLKSLNISKNPIVDVDILTNRFVPIQYETDKIEKADAGTLFPLFPYLESLNASSCSLKTIYTIYAYKNLKTIDLSNNNIESIMPLLSLINLEEIDLSYNSIRELKDIHVFRKLKRLNLRENNLVTYQSLASLKQLEELDLSYSGVKDVSFLKSMTSLKILNLRNNPITDLSPIASLQNLEELNLTDCIKDDFSFLLKLKKLKKLILLNPDRKLLIKLSRALPNLTIETVHSNTINYERY